MKKFFIVFIMCLSFMCFFNVESVSAKSNIQIVKQLCKKFKKPVKIISSNGNFTKIILHRKGKNYILVRKIVSYSSGKKYGWTKDGRYIGYNKKVPKNKKVVSYFIYNPRNNYFDDLLWIVDNNTYR